MPRPRRRTRAANGRLRDAQRGVLVGLRQSSHRPGAVDARAGHGHAAAGHHAAAGTHLRRTARSSAGRPVPVTGATATRAGVRHDDGASVRHRSAAVVAGRPQTATYPLRTGVPASDAACLADAADAEPRRAASARRERQERPRGTVAGARRSAAPAQDPAVGRRIEDQLEIEHRQAVQLRRLLQGQRRRALGHSRHHRHGRRYGRRLLLCLPVSSSPFPSARRCCSGAITFRVPYAKNTTN